MLTIEHCIALTGLSPEEVAALAEHDHLPDIVAAELGNYLVCSEDGCRRLRAAIRDDIAAASGPRLRPCRSAASCPGAISCTIISKSGAPPAAV